MRGPSGAGRRERSDQKVCACDSWKDLENGDWDRSRLIPRPGSNLGACQGACAVDVLLLCGPALHRASRAALSLLHRAAIANRTSRLGIFHAAMMLGQPVFATLCLLALLAHAPHAQGQATSACEYPCVCVQPFISRVHPFRPTGHALPLHG